MSDFRKIDVMAAWEKDKAARDKQRSADGSIEEIPRKRRLIPLMMEMHSVDLHWRRIWC